MRRVVIKARYVQAAGRTGQSAAHLRYIQRDGTARTGEHGQLYSADMDQADGSSFIERCASDRHQFRFIVSPEDGALLADLSAYTRELMRRVEVDLGTKLDWVAVNHYNTGHPHVHIMLRGKDELGGTLLINGAYLAHGLREQASDLATLELGPISAIERGQKLMSALGQDRFTPIDQALIEAADNHMLDLRNAPDDPRSELTQSLRVRRLAKLGKMGLAAEQSPGVWQLSERLQPTLRDLGKRGEAIQTIHRALAAEGRERDPSTYSVHLQPSSVSIVGRLLDKYLNDELGDGLALVIDGIDGRTHHVSSVDALDGQEAPMGSIIEVSSAEHGGKASDRTIAAIAEDGVYRPSLHLERAQFEGRVPGGDYEGFVQAHVRRLEALRRAGIVEGLDADQWRIPADFEARVTAYSADHIRTNIRVLSVARLEQQVGADGATWLDRTLLSRTASQLSRQGFGHQVREALDHRRQHHLGQGDAVLEPNGMIAYRPNLIAVLREREVSRVGSVLAMNKQLPFRAAADGEALMGRLDSVVQLTSGKYAVLEQSHDFTLVPWRPVLDRQIGRQVSGIYRAGSVSWSLSPRRDLGL